MTEAQALVLVAVIGAAQAVVIALIGRLSRRVTQVKRDSAVTRANVASVRENVVNDHTTNLRDENDTRHAETIRLFAKLDKSIGGIRDDNRIMRQDHAALADRVHDNEVIIRQFRMNRKGTKP